MSKDLREIWKVLEAEKLRKPLGGEIVLSKRSRHPVQKLKNGYLISTAMSVLFLIGFILLFFLFHEPIIRLSLSLVIACYVFFLATNLSMYRKIRVSLPVDQSLRLTLNQTVEFVTLNIRFQEKVALFIYPIAATSGFLIGGSSGGDLESFLMQKETIILLLLSVVILTPLCYLLAHWMYKVSYGKWIGELKLMISLLEQAE